MALARAIRARLITAYRRTPPIYKWKNRHGWLFQRLRGGVHDADFQVLRSLDVASPLVIDVGANTGQTIQTVKTLLPQARVVSIEPSPLVLPTLIQLAKRYSDVEIAAFAVGDSFGTAQICTPVANGIHFTQYATLAEVDRDALAAAITEGGFGTVTGDDVGIHKARCVIAPLDAMFTDCDVLKVDAEGYEDSVFRGAAQLVTRALPVLIVERPSPDLAASLAELGYQVLRTEGSVNTVFVHPSRSRGLLAGR